MQFTEKELAMLAVLRRQRDAWPVVRLCMTFLSLFLIAAGAWELYSTGWGAVPLILLSVGGMAASHVSFNWHGPPEASLLLKLIERSEAAPDA